MRRIEVVIAIAIDAESPYGMNDKPNEQPDLPHLGALVVVQQAPT